MAGYTIPKHYAKLGSSVVHLTKAMSALERNITANTDNLINATLLGSK
jgi:hypothetical protein